MQAARQPLWFALGRSDAVGSGVPVWLVIGCHPQQWCLLLPGAKGGREDGPEARTSP